MDSRPMQGYRTIVSKKTAIRPWTHMIAGASGGIATAIVTAPLDVLRTRMQVNPDAASYRKGMIGRVWKLAYNIVSGEGWRGFFKGLGPSISGIVPAMAVKFFTYGNCKTLYASNNVFGQNVTIVHAAAAATAGIATSTVTNPLWVVKTRLQLDDSNSQRRYRNSFDCGMNILRTEGIRGFYRGLAASYLGALETMTHLVLYEQLKASVVSDTTPHPGLSVAHNFLALVGITGAAGASKLLATLLTYPHEVIRTRLRLAPLSDGSLKYTGIVQCARLIYRQEGILAMYGGFVPHMLRSLPSAAITLGVYELVLKRLD